MTDALDVWNLDTGERVQRLTGIQAGLGGMTFSTDASRLFATESTPAPGTPGRLHVWDVVTGRELLTHSFDNGPQMYQFFPGGLRFDADKLHITHPQGELILDGTPLPVPK